MRRPTSAVQVDNSLYFALPVQLVALVKQALRDNFVPTLPRPVVHRGQLPVTDTLASKEVGNNYVAVDGWPERTEPSNATVNVTKSCQEI